MKTVIQLTASLLLATVGATPAVAQVFVPVEVTPTSSMPLGLVAWNGDLYFVDPGFEDTLERVDGETGAASVVGPYLDGVDRTDFVYPATGPGRIYHTADGELWRSDGTRDGSYQLVDGGAFGLNFGTFPLTVGNVVFFDRDLELWRSDGTPGGTVNLHRELNLSGDAAVFGGRLYFTVRDGRMFRTQGDGPGNGPYFDPPGQGEVRFPTTAGDRLYFFAPDASGRFQLWLTGGGANPRRVATERFPEVEYALSAGRRLYFFATGEATGPGLWTSDGTIVRRLTAFDFTRRFPGTQSAVAGDRLWFQKDGELWVTDGTSAGTTATGLLPEAGEFDDLHGLGDVVAATRRRGGGEDLWLTDGTIDGTRRVGGYESLSRRMVRLGRTVYYGARTTGFEFALYAVDLGAPPPTERPQAPTAVRAEGLPGAIRLAWTTVPGALRYVIETRGPRIGDTYEEVAEIQVDGTGGLPATHDELLDGGGPPRTLRIRSENQLGVSEWVEVAATPVDPTADCDTPDATALCLQGGRFRVEVWWRSNGTATDGRGVARSFDFSDDSGTFWFFDPANVELVVKVLDGRVVNGNFWSFYGALSDVEYWVVVTDTLEDTNVTYRNLQGNLCGRGDTAAFPRPNFLKTQAEGKWLRSSQENPQEGTAPAPCTPDGETLCLQNDRFRVTVDWRDPRSGNTGVGRAISGTGDSGTFWFFTDTNVELVVKVLDGTSVNGSHWVFYGALTDVEYTLTVEDTLTNQVRQYTNEPGNICGDADLTAF